MALVRDKTIQQAAESIDALAERAKQALYGGAAAANGATRGVDGAWRFAERTREQAEDVAGQVYQRGQATARQIGRSVEQQPIMALAVVGVLALFIGYMLRGR